MHSITSTRTSVAKQQSVELLTAQLKQNNKERAMGFIEATVPFHGNARI